jgi:hypothetical protein
VNNAYISDTRKECLFKSITKDIYFKQYNLPPIVNVVLWWMDRRKVGRGCLMIARNSGQNMLQGRNPIITLELYVYCETETE